uniref:Uncharacterized protein n=1 Tax=Siphoviridae sp. cttOT32 TaxID=2826493 RepID=A0A8S5QMD9_9CAUD|nr:MAG TPA: hypothetical protein [Siphoviridae sp. cttOT32]
MSYRNEKPTKFVELFRDRRIVINITRYGSRHL